MKSFAEQIPELEKIWLAVKTKFKCEKYVVDQLTNKDIEAYVPLKEHVRRYGARIRKSQVPLINSYIFVHISRSDYVRVLDTLYVLYFIKIGDQLVRVKEEEINLMKKVSGEKVDTFEYLPEELSIGEEVRIISGELTGTVGKLVSFKNKNKLMVELESIGFQMLVEVPSESIYR